jgi:hypothetical protein
MVHYHHVKNMHYGVETLLNELKQRFYITKMRSMVKKVFFECGHCRRLKSVPKLPQMGNLPDFRLTAHSQPFAYTGLDFFGPITISIGRRREKRWGAIFTCLNSRAVHIEVAASLSTDSAIMAIRRFRARRGSIKEIHCDNGTNFRGAETELRRALDELDGAYLNEAFADTGMIWKFNPPAAPHFGGVWERLIKTVKQSLYAVLNEKAPREEILLTFLVEIEFLLNSRPLTYVSSDPNDPESITPNHILIGKNCHTSVPGRFVNDDQYLRRKWRISQYWTDEFWRRWLREYLPTLQQRRKWNKSCENLKVGDVVKLYDEEVRRGVWPIGRIVEVYPGDDGVVRVVKVRTAQGFIKRPVVKIAKISLDDDEQD